MKNIKIALAVIIGLAALSISFYNLNNLRKIESKLLVIETVLDVAKGSDKDINAKSDEVAEQNLRPDLTTFVGTLRKESIPEELELGDYWYWIYFDEPYLLEQNAAGFPMDVDKLQVTNPGEETIDMNVYDGQHVEIKGFLTWGYAESTVIQAEEIVIK